MSARRRRSGGGQLPPGSGSDLLATDGDASLLWPEQTGDDVEQRGLAAPRSAEHPEDGALGSERDIQREVAEMVPDAGVEHHARLRDESQKVPSRASIARVALTPTRRSAAASPPRTLSRV